MQLKKYRIELSFDKEVYLKGFLGSMLRGIFGESLKNYNEKLYDKFFNNKVPPANPAYKYTRETAPPPFIISPLHYGRLFNRQDRLSLHLTLIGSYIQYEKDIKKVFDNLVATKNNGISFKLAKFIPVEEPFYLMDTVDWELYKRLIVQKKNIKITFKTPVILKNNNLLINEFGFDKIFAYLYRRMFLLNQIYGDGSITEQIPENLKINNIETKNICLKQINILRSPTRQNDYRIKAWKGQLEYTGNFDQIYKYLKFGEHIHIGSNTAFGFGKYILE